MSQVLDDFEDGEPLAAEYALGLLSPAEARAFEDLMTVDAGFRARYAFWVESFVSMTDGIDPVTPPTSVRAAIESALFGTPDAATTKPWWQRLGLVPAIAGGLIAALVVLAVVDFNMTPAPFTPTHTARVVAQDDSLIVLAALDPATNTLRIERQAGTIAAGRAQELWVIAGDGVPVSLGVLPDAPVTDLVLDDRFGPLIKSGVLAISDEPAGGSPTGLPTGDVLATGEVTVL